MDAQELRNATPAETEYCPTPVCAATARRRRMDPPALLARQEEGLLGRSPKTSVEDADAGIGLRRLSIGKGAT